MSHTTFRAVLALAIGAASFSGLAQAADRTVTVTHSDSTGGTPGSHVSVTTTNTTKPSSAYNPNARNVDLSGSTSRNVDLSKALGRAW